MTNDDPANRTLADEFELRCNELSETNYRWEIWKDEEFVVGAETGVEAIEALASVAEAGNWYTDSDCNPWPEIVEPGENG